MLEALRLAGCDLGKAAAKLVVVELRPAGGVEIVSTEVVSHGGRPIEAFCEWYRRADATSLAALGVTGLYADAFVAPVLAGLPEDACREAALASAGAPDGPLRVVSAGARGTSVLARGRDGRIVHLENDKCSSGTGETMVRIASRFGLPIEEADRLARAARRQVPITARCSVFAKSEMTHLGNEGRPADELFRGYFGSVARNVAALVARIGGEGPVWAVGGLARLDTFVDALAEALGEPVIVPSAAPWLEALGAAVLAAEQLGRERPGALPADPKALVRPRRRGFAALTSARSSEGRVIRMAPRPVPPGAELRPAVLGLDLGSTGSKAALVDLASGQIVLDLWDRTRGNPVLAARRLVETVLGQARVDVRAIGLTGSGREAVSAVLSATFPGAVDRVLVQNEIVAHATAAIRCDERGGESLSVVEIGGQDAKYIRIEKGRIVDSDMNKACSAGTGSFLEEQALLYGTTSFEDLERLAQSGARPPDLGQMCTVFVSEAAGDALLEGFEVSDLFAGFQHSVIHNYLHRVMGQRTFAERIFFQGKPAQSPSLAWTLAAVSGRAVVVPPNPGAMGAWGIALGALEALGAERLGRCAPIPIAELLEARVVGQSELQCRDRRCETFCRIEKTTVAVAGVETSVLSGGACPKFEISTARPKLPLEAPSPMDERRALLAPLLQPAAGPGPVVGVPLAGALTNVLPFVVTLLRELGAGVHVLAPDAGALSRGEAACHAYDACAPVKLAHGILAGAELDRIFFPKLLGLGDRDGPGGGTCAMEQALPEMIAASLRSRGRRSQVLHPAIDLRDDLATTAARLAPLAACLGAGPRALARAVQEATRAQARFEAASAEAGRRAIAWGRRHGVPVVVVCGALHVLHDRLLSADVPRILREAGALAVPMDCLPLPPEAPPAAGIPWADARRALRSAAAARAAGDLYPVLLGSFGCGPASFVESLFGGILEGHPHTVLESDAHGGTAGYVTRIQSFLHAVRGHDRRPSPSPAPRLALLEPVPERPFAEEKSSRIVFLPLSDRVGGLLSAAHRSMGYDAVAAGPTTREALVASRRDCSGKECLPYQLIWGSFRTHLEREPPDRRTLLVQVTGQGMCRNCLFSAKDRLSLDRMGLSDRVLPRHLGTSGTWSLVKSWIAFVAWGLLGQLAAYHRALERRPGEVDELDGRLCEDLERVMARPDPGGLRRVVDGVALAAGVRGVLDRAAISFAEIGARAAPDPSRRTVLLGGDIFVRLDDVAGDQLSRRLSGLGLQVLLEPASLLGEYLAIERLSELFGLPRDRTQNLFYRTAMAATRRDLHGRVRTRHPWLPSPDPHATIEASRRLLDRHPQGEAPVTLGSALHHWEQRACDGIVVASPWGCGPALVAESLLRHRPEIPALYCYSDGTPIDERRLRAFAFRLRRSPSRTVV